MPFVQFFNRIVSTSALGCLKRTLDEFIESTRVRTATCAGARKADTRRIQNTVSEVARTRAELPLTDRRDCKENQFGLPHQAIATCRGLSRRDAVNRQRHLGQQPGAGV